MKAWRGSFWLLEIIGDWKTQAHKNVHTAVFSVAYILSGTHAIA